MSCCGKKREQIKSTTPRPRVSLNRPIAISPASTDNEGVIEYEYIGRTGLNLIGPVTGKFYRFDRPGARLAVDPRDKPGLINVPLLRPVRIS